MATVKVKGQGHLKRRSRSQKTTKIALLHIFYGKFFDPWCLFGVMSQFKGQGHLKVKFGAIVSYH